MKQKRIFSLAAAAALAQLEVLHGVVIGVLGAVVGVPGLLIGGAVGVGLQARLAAVVVVLLPGILIGFGGLSQNALLEAQDKVAEAQEKVSGAENDLFSSYNTYQGLPVHRGQGAQGYPAGDVRPDEQLQLAFVGVQVHAQGVQ